MGFDSIKLKIYSDILRQELIPTMSCTEPIVKGQVFLWEGADGWEDLWDVDGTDADWKKEI